MNEITPNDIRAKVLSAIEKGTVCMKPRWQFVLAGIAAATVAFILFSAVVYALSLGIFLMRQDGSWFAPQFGGPGWLTFIIAIPLQIVLFALIFVAVLQYVLKRLDLGHRHSVVAIFSGLAALSLVGAFIAAQTPLHHRFDKESHHQGGPFAFMEMWYGKPDGRRSPPRMYRGTIVSSGLGEIVLAMPGAGGTTTVIITPRTRLPSGADFKQGDTLVVMGDEVSTGTVRAFGLQEIDPLQ